MRLAPFCANLVVDREPCLTSTATLWHLHTAISGSAQARCAGRADDRRRAASDPGRVRHAAARPPPRLIRRLEPFDRRFYAGLVGWVDARGDGEWALTLRCAEISGTTARLHAGAGIVAGSEPAAEDLETEAKFGVLLRALGVEPAPV